MTNIFLFLLAFFHPFYVSVTEIRHNPQHKTLEISCKLFFDDLEVAIEKENNVKIDILNPKDKTLINKLIASYLSQHFIVKVNSQNLPIIYVGYEIQGDAAWCYLEANKVEKVNNLEIFDNVFYEIQDSQIHMLNV